MSNTNFPSILRKLHTETHPKLYVHIGAVEGNFLYVSPLFLGLWNGRNYKPVVAREFRKGVKTKNISLIL